MKELLSALNDDTVRAVIATPLLFLLIPAAIYKLRALMVRLSASKQRDLLFQLDNYKWLGQPAMRMQLAVKQAFDRTIDERELDFMLARHNPLTLLLRRKSAGSWVRFQGERYQDARATWLGQIPLPWASRFALIAGIVLTIVCILMGLVLLDLPRESKNVLGGVLFLTYGAIVLVYGAWISARADASHYLMTSVEIEHPLEPIARDKIASKALQVSTNTTPPSSVSTIKALTNRSRSHRNSRVKPSNTE